mmetsp:Transcript_32227/g.78912  ORF Transcript_32227/g.78912 Transcript_32227/m.78912 type:complete len:105 (+) Transcript_32227:125-439(+)
MPAKRAAMRAALRAVCLSPSVAALTNGGRADGPTRNMKAKLLVAVDDRCARSAMRARHITTTNERCRHTYATHASNCSIDPIGTGLIKVISVAPSKAVCVVRAC